MNLLSSKRFKRAKDKDIIFEILDVKKNKTSGLFKNLQEIFTFVVALGIKFRKTEPIVGGSSEPIAIDLFTEDQQKYFDAVILFHDAGNIKKLDKDDPENVAIYLKTIEEYANAGLSILKNKLLVHPEDSFNIISRLIQEELKKDIPTEATGDFEW